ncbi:hypothetical protein SKAU_G00332990 [Synaphobranchus kaupii]|uniref:Uncharacterized protein n=1 Tax=Synaphobranchus kaupii TaxID=118154 RepID=A0A9Q1IGH5_SYNKA|nr:hypothetical protein SKAU_G00332990 [Synaphobranchus kaupii]
MTAVPPSARPHSVTPKSGMVLEPHVRILRVPCRSFSGGTGSAAPAPADKCPVSKYKPQKTDESPSDSLTWVRYGLCTFFSKRGTEPVTQAKGIELLPQQINNSVVPRRDSQWRHMSLSGPSHSCPGRERRLYFGAVLAGGSHPVSPLPDPAAGQTAHTPPPRALARGSALSSCVRALAEQPRRCK